MSTVWRPNPSAIGVVAMAVVRRGTDLLVMATTKDDGTVIGWRPLGGRIELGERAHETVKREFLEELGLELSEPRLVTVIENLYEHHGVKGHQIAFILEARFSDLSAYERETLPFIEGDDNHEVRWMPLESFTSGKATLLPAGLLEHVR